MGDISCLIDAVRLGRAPNGGQCFAYLSARYTYYLVTR